MKTPVTAIACALAFSAAILPPGTTGAADRLQFAQSGPPVPLSPRAPEGGATVKPPLEKRGGIREERLGNVNPESIGVLGASAGGLGARIWSETARSTVAGLTGRLPTTYRSAALRDLARRLLLTRAEAPDGLVVGQSLVAFRLDRLYAMGAIEDAAALVKAAPATLSGSSLALISINVAFLKGDAAAACKAVERHLAKHDTVPLQQANVACLALNKEAAKMMLALGLLREQDAVPDETWERLVEAAVQSPKPAPIAKPVKGKAVKKPAATSQPISVTSLKQAGPTHLALMAALKLPLPTDAAENKNLAMLRALAMNKEAPAAVRLRAGEAAARGGALSGAELGRVYATVDINSGEIARSVAMARETFDAVARARLFKAAARERNPRRRAHILRTVWRLSREHGGYTVAARVFSPFVADMAPSAELRRFAPAAARALYTAGEVQLATAWYRIILDGPRSKAADMLWPIARLAAPERILWDDGRLQAWASIQLRQGKRKAVRRIAILRTLLIATGDPEAGNVDWAALSKAGVAPAHRGAIPRLWRSMRASAVGGRVGETVLRVLTGIEKGDLSNLDHVDLGLVLKSLRDVRLTAELRAVALEAALANGL